MRRVRLGGFQSVGEGVSITSRQFRCNGELADVDGVGTVSTDGRSGEVSVTGVRGDESLECTWTV